MAVKEGKYWATWKREFKIPWRKAGLLKSSRWSSGFGSVGCQLRTLSAEVSVAWQSAYTYLPYVGHACSTARINPMVSTKSIHTQTRQLNPTIPCHKIKLTDLWVNWLERNHLINTFCEINAEHKGAWQSAYTYHARNRGGLRRSRTLVVINGVFCLWRG